MIELTDGGYPERTAQNVADSDGTLVISNGEPIGGTRETVERCIELLARDRRQDHNENIEFTTKTRRPRSAPSYLIFVPFVSSW